MHILFELLGLFVLGIFSIVLVALALLLIGFFGYTETHNPLFAIPFVLGLMFLSALD
jgi:hypothetical protein